MSSCLCELLPLTLLGIRADVKKKKKKKQAVTTGLTEKVLILQFPGVTLGDSYMCMLCQVKYCFHKVLPGQMADKPPLSDMTWHRQCRNDVPSSSGQQPHAGPHGDQDLLGELSQVQSLLTIIK